MSIPSSPAPSLRHFKDIEHKQDLRLEGLPPEILERIFYLLFDDPSESKLIAIKEMRYGAIDLESSRAKAIKAMHKRLPFVSKTINEGLINSTNHWLNQKVISLGDVGCKNSKEAVQYIIDHNLPYAHLSAFRDVEDEDLKYLSSSCPQVISLSLRSENFTDAGLADALEKLIGLMSLDLNSCDEFAGGDKFAEALGKLIQLQSLDLTVCYKISGNDKFAEALGKLIHLLNLNLSICNNLSTDKITEAIGKLANLRKLNLDGCTHPGDLLSAQLKNIPLLESLNLSGCEQLSGDQLIAIANDHPRLKNLALAGMRHIPAEQILEALKAFMQLQNLDISGCQHISGDQFIEIARICPHLQNLDMDFCYQVSGDQIEIMLENLAHLKYLRLWRIPIPKEKQTDLSNRFPSVTFLFNP